MSWKAVQITRVDYEILHELSHNDNGPRCIYKQDAEARGKGFLRRLQRLIDAELVELLEVEELKEDWNEGKWPHYHYWPYQRKEVYIITAKGTARYETTALDDEPQGKGYKPMWYG